MFRAVSKNFIALGKAKNIGHHQDDTGESLKKIHMYDWTDEENCECALKTSHS